MKSNATVGGLFQFRDRALIVECLKARTLIVEGNALMAHGAVAYFLVFVNSERSFSGARIEMLISGSNTKTLIEK